MTGTLVPHDLSLAGYDLTSNWVRCGNVSSSDICPNDGLTVLYFKNESAAIVNAVIDRLPCSCGGNHDITVSMPATAGHMLTTVFWPIWFGDPLQISYTDSVGTPIVPATTVQVLALRTSRAVGSITTEGCYAAPMLRPRNLVLSGYPVEFDTPVNTGNTFVNTGNEVLLLKNIGAEIVVTVTGVYPCEDGSIHSASITVPATTGYVMTAPFAVSRFSTLCNVTYSITPTTLSVLVARTHLVGQLQCSDHSI